MNDSVIKIIKIFYIKILYVDVIFFFSIDIRRQIYLNKDYKDKFKFKIRYGCKKVVKSLQILNEVND